MRKSNEIFICVIICMILYLSCQKDKGITKNTEEKEEECVTEFREGFSESEFKKAIIGKWQSAYEIPGRENVLYLELNRNGEGTVVIGQDSIRKEYKGSYSVAFLRPPSQGDVTLAEITISTSKGNIILSRVNFGPNNLVSGAEEFFLRIDRPPYGTLRKIC